ncbi:MAG TPA: bifunctional precorrin-2 dehydrogenase/sirohydrochlorin ferrochelatase [Candidatus Koribacter sp.]|jgi:precorrin-2 dehydrogenase/sirohydrochlorin ferrochelatase
MAALFPAFLKLEGRRCLVVGGGAIAEQKLGGLLDAGATVVVVAPHASPQTLKLAREGALKWKERGFEPRDVAGVALVIAATGDPAVNEQVFREADRRGIFCNAVDEPERCHFYYPAVVRRGDLQIAISTNGKSPALAQRIRKELETIFDSRYAEWLRWLGHVRELYFRTHVAREQRVRALHRIAARPVYERFRDSRNAER